MGGGRKMPRFRGSVRVRVRLRVKVWVLAGGGWGKGSCVRWGGDSEEYGLHVGGSTMVWITGVVIVAAGRGVVRVCDCGTAGFVVGEKGS